MDALIIKGENRSDLKLIKDMVASRLASGMYIYRIVAGDYVEVRKLMLMK